MIMLSVLEHIFVYFIDPIPLQLRQHRLVWPKKHANGIPRVFFWGFPLLDQPPIITGRFGSPITTKSLTENVISNSLVYFCSPRVMEEPVFSFSIPGLIPLMLSGYHLTG